MKKNIDFVKTAKSNKLLSSKVIVKFDYIFLKTRKYLRHNPMYKACKWLKKYLHLQQTSGHNQCHMWLVSKKSLSVYKYLKIIKYESNIINDKNG